jgi:endonuclease YncB( thermonuclease family)
MSAPTPPYIYNATFITAHDGDTVTLRLDHGSFPTAKAETTAPFRIRNLYCPELKEPGGFQAMTFSNNLLIGARQIVVQTHKTPTAMQGSFARTIADVWVDGQSLADLVIAAGHGSATPGPNWGSG